MTDPYSPYSVPESQPPKWKPGEKLAAAAFVGICLFLVLDINVGIFRVFKKRQGLYYWSMLLGTLACAVDALGVILKYLVPNSRPVWPLYTLLLLGGWSVYAPAQLLVLYSRLHLVNNSYKIQRWVLILIMYVYYLVVSPRIDTGLRVARYVAWQFTSSPYLITPVPPSKEMLNPKFSLASCVSPVSFPPGSLLYLHMTSIQKYHPYGHPGIR